MQWMFSTFHTAILPDASTRSRCAEKFSDAYCYRLTRSGLPAVPTVADSSRHPKRIGSFHPSPAFRPPVRPADGRCRACAVLVRRHPGRRATAGDAASKIVLTKNILLDNFSVWTCRGARLRRVFPAEGSPGPASDGRTCA
jgi:hypothetical protein